MGTITEDDQDQHSGVHMPGTGVNPGQEHYRREVSRPHPSGDSDLDRHDLRHAEDDATGSTTSGGASSGTSADAAESNSLYRGEKEGDKDAPTPARQRPTLRGMLGKAKGAFSGKKHKMRRRLLLIFAGLCTAMIPIFIFLALLLLALKVPHFVANVAAWQFARNVRVTTKSAENVMNEAIGLQGASDDWLTRARSRYAGMRDATYRNMERFSSAILVRNLQRQNKLLPVETPRGGALGKLGFTRVKAITINDRSVLVPNSLYSYSDKYIHPIATLRDRLAFYNAVDDALNTYNPHLNTFIRSRATLKILTSQFGDVGFKGIIMAKFFGKSKLDAAVEAQRQVYATAKPKVASPAAAPEQVKKAAQDVADETDNCVQDKECIKTTVTQDGIPPSAADVAEKAFTESTATAVLKGVLGALNPIYQVAVPVCLVYSGSVFDPDASNNQSDAVQREATQMFSADSQIKRGDINTAKVKDGSVDVSTPTEEDNQYNVNGDGVGAISQKLDGNDGKGIINSNAMLRADGQNPNTLTTGTGTQMTAMGGYGRTTIFDVLLNSKVSQPINSVADKFCPAATNIWVGVGVAAANLVALAGTAFFTAGTGAAAEYGSEAAAEAAAQSGMRVFVDTIINGFTTREGAVSMFGKTGRFGYQFGKRVTRDTALILGTVYLARLLTFHNAGSFHNGLATGTLYANDIDNGANQISNTTCRSVYYGRPLTYAETAQSDQDDITTRFQTASRQTTYQRYLALSNPNSMLTKFGQSTVLKVDHNTPRNMLTSMANIFNPSAFFTKLFGSLTSKASAAANVETENYGNIQCGYTRDEMKLMNPTGNADASYQSPSENAYRLDYAGEDTYNEIEDEYGPCFTQKIGTLMTTKDDDGHLYIERTDHGDLNSASVCSPQNLGPNNPKYGDLVFRYRLAHLYDNTIHTMYGIQTAGANELGSKNGNNAQPAPAGGN